MFIDRRSQDSFKLRRSDMWVVAPRRRHMSLPTELEELVLVVLPINIWLLRSQDYPFGFGSATRAFAPSAQANTYICQHIRRPSAHSSTQLNRFSFLL